MEVYYDPDGVTTLAGQGPMNLEQHGFTLLKYFYNKEYQTFCIIALHEQSKWLVVSFRGTSSNAHWRTNRKFSAIHVSIKKSRLTDLDRDDGLEMYQSEDNVSYASTNSPSRNNSRFDSVTASSRFDSSDSEEDGQEGEEEANAANGMNPSVDPNVAISRPANAPMQNSVNTRIQDFRSGETGGIPELLCSSDSTIASLGAGNGAVGGKFSSPLQRFVCSSTELVLS